MSADRLRDSVGGLEHEEVAGQRILAQCVDDQRAQAVKLPTHVGRLRASQSIPLNIAEGNGKQSLKDKNPFFEIARGSALECAAIHDMLLAFAAINEESNRQGKSQLRRIVSMLTQLIQRPDQVAERAIEYEYEYRDAEYE